MQHFFDKIQVKKQH